MLSVLFLIGFNIRIWQLVIILSNKPHSEVDCVIDTLRNTIEKKHTLITLLPINVTLLPKTGDPRNPGNWRPISQTCIFAEILESIVKSRLQYFQKSNVHKYEQGFGLDK